MIPVHTYLTSTLLSRPSVGRLDETSEPGTTMAYTNSLNTSNNSINSGSYGTAPAISHPVPSTYQSHPIRCHKNSNNALHKTVIEKTVAEDLYIKAIEEKERLRVTASNTLNILKTKLLSKQDQAKALTKKLQEMDLERNARYKVYKAFKEAYDLCKSALQVNSMQEIAMATRQIENLPSKSNSNAIGRSQATSNHSTHGVSVNQSCINESTVESDLSDIIHSFPWKEFEAFVQAEEKYFQSYATSTTNRLNVPSTPVSPSHHISQSVREEKVEILSTPPPSNPVTNNLSIHSPLTTTPSPGHNISYNEQKKQYFEERIRALTDENKSLKQEVKELKSELEVYVHRDSGQLINESGITPRNIFQSIENEVIQINRPLSHTLSGISAAVSSTASTHEAPTLDACHMVDKRCILDMKFLANDDDFDFDETMSSITYDSGDSSPREHIRKEASFFDANTSNIGPGAGLATIKERDTNRSFYGVNDTIDGRLRKVHDTLQENLAQIRQTNTKVSEYKDIHLKLISRQLSQRLDKLQEQVNMYQQHYVSTGAGQIIVTTADGVASTVPANSTNATVPANVGLNSFLSPILQKQASTSWPMGSSFASSTASASSYESYEFKKLQKLNKTLQEQLSLKDKENRDLKHNIMEQQTQLLLQHHHNMIKANTKRDIFDILERSIKGSTSLTNISDLSKDTAE